MQKPLLPTSLVYLSAHIHRIEYVSVQGEIEKDDNNNILIVENLIVEVVISNYPFDGVWI